MMVCVSVNVRVLMWVKCGINVSLKIGIKGMVRYRVNVLIGSGSW